MVGANGEEPAQDLRRGRGPAGQTFWQSLYMRRGVATGKTGPSGREPPLPVIAKLLGRTFAVRDPVLESHQGFTEISRRAILEQGPGRRTHEEEVLHARGPR